MKNICFIALSIAAGIGIMVCIKGCSKPDELKISATSLEFPYSGQETSFTVQSNVSWKVSSDAATWLTVSPTSGSSDGTVTVSADENTSISERTAIITVNVDNIKERINVTQAGAPLIVSTNTLSFPSSAEQRTFTISSDISWAVQSSETWLTVSPSSGANDGTVTVTVDDNTSTLQRTATITITGGDITQIINVTQTGVPPILSIKYTGVTLLSHAEEYSLDITSNVSWTVSVSSDATSWLTVTPLSGFNDGTITLKCTENLTTERSTTITISGEDITLTYRVKQRGKNDPTGSITFWTDQAYSSNIRVSFTGIDAKYITGYYTSGVPNCGDTYTATFSYQYYDAYSFSASTGSGANLRTWWGTVTLNSNCVTIKLNNANSSSYITQ